MAQRITAYVEDVDGSFRALYAEAPKVYRKELAGAVQLTAFAVQQRMKAAAPVGPLSPHIRHVITTKQRGMSARVGYFEGEGGDELAHPGAGTWKSMPVTNALVAMFNEYGVTPPGGSVKRQNRAFMRKSLIAENDEFVRNVKDVLMQVERNFSGGGLL